MAEENTYRPLENVDEDFHLAPITYGLYEKIKLKQLMCSAINAESKVEIMKEFNIEKVPLGKTIGIGELFKFYCENLFMETHKVELKQIRLDELGRAANDFFLKAAGN